MNEERLLKVIHIIPSIGTGGAEKLLVDSLKYYKEKNIQCDVAVLSNYDNVYATEIEKQGVALYVSQATFVYSLENIFFIKNLLKQKSYDIVHCHLYAAQLFTPIAMKLALNKAKIITTEHSTSNRRRSIFLFKLLDRMMYRTFENIICISDAVKDALDQYLPSVENKTVIIYNGIENETFNNAKAVNWRDEIDNYCGEKIILMVASLRHQKDPFTLIRAAKILGSGYRIVFVGEGELLEEAKTFSEKQKVEITFLGQRKDIPALMKGADVFVLSSHWEGFGLVIVEAAAANVPIVATDVPGLRDIVKELNGLLFEKQNAEQLAAQIIKAPESNVQFCEKYHIKHMVENYIKLYKEI